MSKRINRMIATLLVIVLLAPIVPAPAAQAVVPKYRDIQGHWGESNINSWLNSGLAGGYPDGTFRPNQVVNRAEFISFLNRAFGYIGKANIAFSDVGPADWFYPEVVRGIQAGYVSGFADGTFRPHAPVSRIDAAEMLYAAMRLSRVEYEDVIGDYTDNHLMSAAQRVAANAVVSEQLMVGKTLDTFSPHGIITRAETIAILDRAAGEIFKQSGTYGPVTGQQIIRKNVTVSVRDVSLQNMTIEGDLYLTEGIGDGDVTLDNVIVKGTTTIAGGGPNSVHLLDSKFATVIVSKDGVRVVVEGSTTTDELLVEAQSIIETISGSDGTLSVHIRAAANVTLIGNFARVEVSAPNAIVNLTNAVVNDFTIGQLADGTIVNLAADSSVNTLTLDAAATISGAGQIGAAQISAAGTVIDQNPVQVTLAPGVTAIINGQERAGTPAGDPGGSGSTGNGSSGGGGDGGGGEPPAPVKHSIVVTVVDGLTDATLSGASVTVGGSTVATDASGQATFSLVNGAYSCAAQTAGYYGDTGNITVSGGAVARTVTLAPQSISTASATTVFGPSSGTLIVPGDFVINMGGITLRNTTINGDLLLGSSIGPGTVTLEHVTVTGTTTVAGGGSHSIVLFDCDLYAVTVDYDGVHIVAKGDTTVRQQVVIQSGATLDASNNNDGTLTVTIPSSVSESISVGLTGSFGSVALNAPNTLLSVTAGTVQSLDLGSGAGGSSVTLEPSANVGNFTADAPAIVLGGGSIESASINACGVTMQQTPEQCVFGSGVSAAVGGSDLTTSYYRVAFQANVAATAVTVGATTVTSDATGLAVFSLPDGTYSYTAEAGGYQPVSGAVTVFGQGVTQTVALAGYEIIFRVTDRGTGLPVSGAEVVIGSETATTDASGAATFSRPGVTSYDYSVQAPGYKTSAGTVAVSAAPADCSVALGWQPPIGNNLVMFLVTDPDGAAIDGAAISVGGSTVQTVTGQVEVALPSGTHPYSIVHSVPPETIWYAVGTVSVSGQDMSQNVTLSTEAPSTYPVVFRVTDAAGRPLEGVKVSVDGDGPSATTDGYGDALFSLANGEHSFATAAAGYTGSSGSLTVSSDVLTQQVELAAATAAPVYLVSFEVNGLGGALAGASIAINGETLTTDVNGLATIELLIGAHGYTVTAVGYGKVIGSMPVTVSGGAATIGLQPQAYPVTFRATDAAGKAVPGVTVAVGGVATLTTDLFGNATTHLINGSYNFTVSAAGAEADPSKGTVIVDGAAVTEPITVTAAAATVYPITFAVTDQAGVPVQGASVTIGGGTVTTDASGTAVIRLADGHTYAYRVAAKGFVLLGSVTLAGAAETRTVAFIAMNPATLTSLTLSGSPALAYDGQVLSYDLAELSLQAQDQFNADFILDEPDVDWTLVESDCATLPDDNSILSITGDGSVTVTATIGVVTSAPLRFAVNKAAPRLASLTLGGAPTLVYTGVRALVTYDLNNLTLTGCDQFGDPFVVSTQAATWAVSSGPAYLAGASGLNVLSVGQIYVTASIGNITSEKLKINVSRTGPTLSSLALDGEPPLVYGIASFTYDLSELTLQGYDQFGAFHNLAGLTVTWTVAGDHAALDADGQTMTVTGTGPILVTAKVGAVESNSLGLAVTEEPAKIKVISLSGSPSLIYNGDNLAYDLTELSLAATDQYGNAYQAIAADTVTWNVSGPASVGGSMLTVTNSGSITLSATAGGITSGTLLIDVGRNQPRLVLLTVTGTIPGLVMGGDGFDLDVLTLNGQDQFGADYPLESQTVTWSIASGGTHASIAADTHLLTPVSLGSGGVTATVAGITSEAVSFAVVPAGLSLVSALDDATALTFYDVQLVSGGTAPYTWEVLSGTLPPDLALNSDGTLNGLLTVNGVYGFAVRVTDSNDCVATQNLTLNVVLPSIPESWNWPSDWPVGEGYYRLVEGYSQLPPAMIGKPYRYFLQARGDELPYSYQIDLSMGGNPPPGMTLSEDGVLSGTPTEAGYYPIGMFVSTSTRYPSGNYGCFWTKATLCVAEPLTIADTLPDLMANDTDSVYQQVIFGGLPSYRCFITDVKRDGVPTQYGEMPNGVGFFDDGTFGGTTGEAGVYTFTLTVTDDSNPTQTVSKQMTLNVMDCIEITTGSVNAEAGVPFSVALTATGGAGPYTWDTWLDGLPDGLNLDSVTGTLSGTVKAAGTYTAYVTVTDSANPQHTVERFVSLALCPSVALADNYKLDSISGIPCTFNLHATGGAAPYTWSVPAASLPDGLTVHQDGSSFAQATGTPEAAGIYRFPVQVTDALGGVAVQTCVLTLYDALAVKTTMLPNAAVGVAYRQALAASGGSGSYVWSLENGSLPAGLSLSADGVISGTPTTAGGVSFRVAVRDASSSILYRDQVLSLNVSSAAEPLTVATISLPQGTVNVTYPEQVLQPAGGAAPYSWSLQGGSLPAGLSLSSGGAITGKPTSSGTYAFTATVADGSATPQTATAELGITISDTLEIADVTLPAMTQGVAYTHRLMPLGGAAPYTWTLQGAVPGMALDADGMLHGTPTMAGRFGVHVQVMDDSRPYRQAVTLYYPITVNPPAMAITTESLSAAVVGDAYSQTLAAAGGYLPAQSGYTWSVTDGSLPAGLTFHSYGAVTGEPTAVGTFQFTVQAADRWSPANTAVAALSITVVPALVSTTFSLPGGRVGQDYALALTTEGGIPPYSWSALYDSLPPGLDLSAAGVLSGKPTLAGSYQLQILLCDSATPSHSFLVTLPLTILPALSIGAAAPHPGTVASSYYFAGLNAQHGTAPYSWSIKAGTLPTGLTLNAATGIVSGQSTAAGTFNCTVQVTDSSHPAQVATRDMVLVVSPAPLTMLTRDLSAGAVAVPYSQMLSVAGGAPAYTWSLAAGSLPSGLFLNAQTGVISGTPTAQGDFSFTIQAADGGTPQQTASVNLQIAVAPGPLAIPSGDLTLTIPANVGLSKALFAIGGTAPYTWSVVSGSLPTGLSLDGDGTISGTPTAENSFWCRIQAVDSTPGAPKTTWIGVSFNVRPQLAVTTSSLPATVVGAEYSQTIAAIWGQTPLAWSLATGSQLPAGLTLHPETGVLSGTLNAQVAPGTYPFTVQVSDSADPAETATASLYITVNSDLQVVTASLPAGTVNSYYSQTLMAAGGTSPYTWSIDAGSQLPAGISLNPITGMISGVPTAPGAYSFSVQVADVSQPGQTATASVSLRVAGGLTVTTSELAPAGADAAYNQELAASGGDGAYRWSLVDGTQLPAGLSLASNGTISGRPVAAGSQAFIVSVTDGASRTTSYGLMILVYPALSITTTLLPDGALQQAYTAQVLAAEGGSGAYVWSLGNGAQLPDGISLSATGVLAGTPTAAGLFNFSVQATDAYTGAAATVQLSIKVPPDSSLQVDSRSLPTATLGMAYSQSLAAAGGNGPYAWAVSAGALPAGLSLSPAGVLSGTPSATGAYIFHVHVTDGSSPAQTATAVYGVWVFDRLTVVNQSLSDGSLGRAYYQTLIANHGTSPYTWSLAADSQLPSGLVLDSSSGVISGTPASVGLYSFTVQATDNGNPQQTAMATLSINIGNGDLVVATAALPPADVWDGYSQALMASGGTGPYSWQLTQGVLPNGLTLNSTTGIISGTPTAGGVAYFVLRVIDSSAQTSDACLGIWVREALSIDADLPAAGLRLPYSAALSPRGGLKPHTLSITRGALPVGLSLDEQGVITGIPTVAGVYDFTVTLTDNTSQVQGEADQTLASNLSITVYNELQISLATLASGVVGRSYSQTMAVAGGAGASVWAVIQGSLPNGLALNAATGAITGTPTTAGASAFTLQATDIITGAVASVARTIIIQPLLALTTAGLPGGLQHCSYNQVLPASGGAAPYTWTVSAGSLPAGLKLNSATGAITGTPTAGGNASFTVQVKDSGDPRQTASVALSIAVKAAVAATISGVLTTGVVHLPYSQTLTAKGGTAPYVWSVAQGSLPAGLTLNAATGVISGTPTAAGVASFSVRIQESSSAAQTAIAAFSIAINAPLQIQTAGLASGMVGVAHSAALTVSDPVGPVTWSVASGALPDGLALDAATGVISGTPIVSGVSSFSVLATDSAVTPQTATAAFSITVKPSLILSTTALASGTVSVPYSQTLTATGGKQPYIWATSGTLPPGLAIDPSTGVISGTPQRAGSFSFTAVLADGNLPAQFAQVNLTVTIAPAPLVISSSSPAAATFGVAYRQELTAVGGTGPYTWSTADALPQGLSLSSDGVISGIPTATGTVSFGVQATDASQASVSARLSIQVLPLAVTAVATEVAGSGFTLILSPTVAGLDEHSLNMTDAHGRALTITSAVSMDSGASYQILLDSTLVAGEPCALTISQDGYQFNSVTVKSPVASGGPTLTSAVLDVDGTTLMLTFNQAMATPPAAPAGFAVAVNGMEDAVTAIVLSPDYLSLKLTLANAVPGSAEVLLSIAPGAISASDGTVLSAISGWAVTNGASAAGVAAAAKAADRTATAAATALCGLFGLTAQEAATTLLQAGYAPADIAPALCAVYSVDATSVATVLRASGLTPGAVATALAAIQNGAGAVTEIMRAAGYDAIAVAGALLASLPSELSNWGNGDQERGAIVLLHREGYSASDIVRALRQVFADDIDGALESVLSYFWSETPAALSAVAQVYGHGSLAAWAYDQYGLDYAAQVLASAGVSAAQACGYLHALDENAPLDALVWALWSADYSLSDFGAALLEAHNATAGEMAIALTPEYEAAQIKDYLVNGMQIGAAELLQLMMHGPAYLPDYCLHDSSAGIAAFLRSRYPQDALAFAALLYQGGWTEANGGQGPRNDGYGLHAVISALKKNYGMTTALQWINSLGGLGLSSLAIATEMKMLTGSSLVVAPAADWLATWTSAYRQAGYAATDLAFWCVSAGSGYGNVAQAIRLLKTAGYSLPDIALALKEAFGQSETAATTDLIAAALWSNASISAAIQQAYGSTTDPITAVIQNMQASGATATQAANTLRYTMNVTDPTSGITYLAQAGYNLTEVMAALVAVYHYGTPSRLALQQLNPVMQNVYAQQQDSMVELLQAHGIAAPGAAIPALHTAGYSLYNIVQFLKNKYSQTADESLDLLTQSGYYGSQAVAAEVNAAYVADPVLIYLQYLFGTGASATDAVGVMNVRFDVRVWLDQAAYLAKAGYAKQSVLQSFFTYWELTKTAAILQGVYGVIDDVTMARELATFYGTLYPDTTAKYVTVAKALQRIYPTLGIPALAKVLQSAGFPAGPYQSDSIAAWLYAVTTNAKNDAVAAILGSKSGDDLGLALESAYHVLKNQGYAERATLQWLLADGFSPADVSDFTGYGWVRLSLKEGLSGAAVNGITVYIADGAWGSQSEDFLAYLKQIDPASLATYGFAPVVSGPDAGIWLKSGLYTYVGLVSGCEPLLGVFTLGDSSARELPLTLSPARAESIFSVKNGRNSAVQGALVSVVDPGQGLLPPVTYTGTTDAAGTVSFKLRAGSFAYTVRQAGYELYSGLLNVNGEQTKPVILTQQVTVSIVDILPTGFTVAFSPAVPELTVANFKLMSGGKPVPITSVLSKDGATAYQVTVPLAIAQLYSLDLACPYYRLAQGLPVSWSGLSVNLSAADVSGVTLTLSPAVPGLTAANFTLQDGGGQPVAVKWASSGDAGATYRVSADLVKTFTYTATLRIGSFSWPTPVLLQPALQDAYISGDGLRVRLVFDKPMAAPADSPAGFAVYLGGDQLTIADVRLDSDDARVMDLVLENPVYEGSLSFCYQPGGVQALDGASLDAISGAAVRVLPAALVRAYQLQLQAATAADVAAVLSSDYAMDAPAAAFVLAAVYLPGQAAQALRDVWHRTAEQAARDLTEAGCRAADVAAALRDVYGTSDAAAAQALTMADVLPAETCRALQAAYGSSAAVAADALRLAGIQPADLASALSTVFGDGAAAAAMAASGFTAQQIAAALQADPTNATAQVAAATLRAAGYAATDTLAIWQSDHPTDASAAQFLQAAGFASTQVAVVMVTVYECSDLDAAAALQSAGFSIGEIALGLSAASGSDYAAVSALQGIRVGPVEIAGVLQGAPFQYTADAAAAVLFSLGFTAPETMDALLQVFFTAELVGQATQCLLTKYSPAAAAEALRVTCGYGVKETAGILGSYYGGFLSGAALYQAIAQGYGEAGLMAYLWDLGGLGLGSYPNSLSRMLEAGLEVGQSFYYIVSFYPQLTMAEAAYLFAANHIGFAEAAPVLVAHYRPDAKSLAVATKNYYSDSDILNYMAHDMRVSAAEIIELMMHGPGNLPDYGLTAGPTQIIEFLFDHYRPEPHSTEELAALLYRAGWNEANDGMGTVPGGYGLKTLAYALHHTFGLSSISMINLLKSLGLSPVVVADTLSQVFGGGVGGWWIDFRQAGYTATDFGATGLTDLATFVDKLGQTQYGLTETLLALKHLYNPSRSVMQTVLTEAALRNGLGWSVEAITAAVMSSFTADPVRAAVTAMKANESTTATQVASALKDTFLIADVLQAVGYLATAGYNASDVTTAALRVYYPGADAVPADIAVAIYARCDELYTISQVLALANATTPQAAVTALRRSGFTLQDIAATLKNTFGQSGAQAIGVLTQSGLFAQSAVNAAVEAVYQADMVISYIAQSQHKYAWYGIGNAMLDLRDKFAIVDPPQVVALLRQLNYPAAAVFNELVAGQAYCPSDRELVSIMRDAFGWDIDILISRSRTAYGRQWSMVSAINDVFQTGFGDIAVRMRNHGYNITSITTWIRFVLPQGKDDSLAAVLGREHSGLQLPARDAAEILFEREYSLSEAATWLKQDGYRLGEMLGSLVIEYSYDNLVPVLTALRSLYSIDELAEQTLEYNAGPEDYDRYRSYCDLVNAGYTEQEVITALLKRGLVHMSQLMSIVQQKRIDARRAMSATGIACFFYDLVTTTPGVTITLMDIYQGLDNAQSRNDYRRFFSREDIYDAMQVVAGRYLRAIDEDGGEDIAALYIMRCGGLAADGAASLMASEGVGLSAWGVIKGILGIGSDWMEAVMRLAQAGYSLTDSISAIWNNPDYHMVIGISVLSSMITSSLSYLSAAPELMYYFKWTQRVAKFGLKLNSLIAP